MEKKKILFVMTSLFGGGAERVVANIVRHLDSRKYDVHLLLVLNKDHSYTALLPDTVQIHYLDKPGRIRHVFISAFRRIVTLRPDLVFMGFGELNLLISLLIPFYRKCQWLARETNMVSEKSSKFRLFLYKYFYRNYDMIIAQCNDMKNDLLDHVRIPEQQVVVINNPVDCSYIDSRLKEGPEPDYPEKINLLACGKWHYQKGFDLLLKEFHSIRYREKYHLTILGTGDDKMHQELKTLILSLQLTESVTLAGFAENPHPWFQKADLFILSSRYEGFPNVLLESLYTGTPAIANACKGGINEIIKEGINGYIFDFNKENSFQENLDLALEMDFIRKVITKDIKDRFGIDGMIMEFDTLFCRMLE